MAVTTELVVVRHGEANRNVTGVVGGDRGCIGLSPRGHDQARKLAARLAAEHRDRPFRQSWSEMKTAFGGPPQHRPDEPYAPGAEPWNVYLVRFE